MEATVSTYSSYAGRQHTGDATVAELVERIRTNGDPRIDVLREIQSEGTRKTTRREEFDAIKLGLPAFTPSARLRPGQKADSKVVSLSDLLYVDLDGEGCEGDVLSMRLRPETVCTFRSVSGRGYGVLVSVSGITVESFRYHQTCYLETLRTSAGISYDSNAKGMSRACVVSKDPEVWFNPRAVPFELPEKGPFGMLERERKFERTERPLSGTQPAGSTGWVPRFQTQLSDEEYAGRDYVVIPEGREFVRTHLMGVQEGNRNSKMRTLALGILHNNPDITVEGLESWMHRANSQWLSKSCQPLPPREVHSIVRWTWKRFREGTLQFHSKRRKKVWFKDGCGLSAKEKRSISAVEVGKLKSDKTQRLIYEAIEGLQSHGGRITQELVSERSGVKLRTVKRHWKEFKQWVKELNSAT